MDQYWGLDLQVRKCNLHIIYSYSNIASDNFTDTQPLFSEIASTEENRIKFAVELGRFMIHYGFDGVDIDWVSSGSHRD